MHFNYPRLILSIIATYIFVFAFDFMYHDVLLVEVYNDTAFLWRSPEEVIAKINFILAVQFCFSLIMCVLYAYYAPQTNFGQGLRFGFAIGLLLGLMQMGTYTFMPVSFLLTWLWFSGTFFQCLTMGAIMGLIYKRNNEGINKDELLAD